jgi:hypothetical protein
MTTPLSNEKACPLLTRMLSNITVLSLDNGDSALYVYGQCLECADQADGDKPVEDTGRRLASILNISFQLLHLPVPEDEEWCWNDIVNAPDEAPEPDNEHHQ